MRQRRSILHVASLVTLSVMARPLHYNTAHYYAYNYFIFCKILGWLSPLVTNNPSCDENGVAWYRGVLSRRPTSEHNRVQNNCLHHDNNRAETETGPPK